MQSINAAKLGNEIRISEHLRNPNEHVRISNLRAGQDLIIDTDLDGAIDDKYTYPDGPAAWLGSPDADGKPKEGIHAALLMVVNSSGFALHFGGKAELRNSRGRGLAFGNCHEFHLHDSWVRGARTAGITFDDSSNFTVHRPVTIDTGNYQNHKGVGPNWPGSIKAKGCRNYSFVDAISVDHVGNAITATECSNGEWLGTIAVDVLGASHYINASPDHSVRRAVHVARSNAYIVNSEEENEGTSEGVIFGSCYALGEEWGVGFWGNEGKQGIVIERAGVLDCLLVTTEGIKIHPNATITHLDRTGTIWQPLAEANPAWLAKLRDKAAGLKKLILAHADWRDIDAARMALRTEFEWIRAGQEKPPVEVPIDRDALRAWMAKADELVPQLEDWLRRGKLLVG